MSVTYLCCPKCGSALGQERSGLVDVPDGMLGKRRKTKMSSQVRCTFCKVTYRSKSATLWENYGRDGRTQHF